MPRLAGTRLVHCLHPHPIEQGTARADHAMDAAQLTAIGRDVESAVLARAVVWHAERRVLLNGHKTVIFN